ncbi:hypothetical protein ACQJBY_040175 [Aegilops geniculata]
MNVAAAAMENDQLMQQVNKQRYLVVLEDVSTVVEWDAIKMYLPDSNNGSRVIMSTQHLRIALMCTGNPYQVSQLTCFSDGQSLCAFSKEGSVLRSDLGEFNWQIRCHGVISVVLPEFWMSDCISDVYWCIVHKCRSFKEVVFNRHSWVDVPNPFNVNVFVLELFLNFLHNDFEAREMEEFASMGCQAVIELCCEFLREDGYLIVLNGLKSKEDWDVIKGTFLSGRPTKGASSIIVITHEETIAKHCVDGQKNRVFSYSDVKDDEVLGRLIQDSIGSRGMLDFSDSHLFYNRFKERKYWSKEFELVGREHEVSALDKKIGNPGVIAVWGSSGAGKSVLVRSVYYRKICNSPSSELGAFSLVSVPHPFNLKDFSWHLLLDFCTHANSSSKEAVALDLMIGKVDPIQACREWLCKNKCLVVIDGLQSKHDWEKIRTAFLSIDASQSSHNCIIVITDNRSVAKHCVDNKKDRLLKVKPFIKDLQGPGYLVGRGEELCRLKKCHPGVTCIWGIAGVGKSALARAMYDDGFVSYKMSWVNVSHPFNLT